MPRLLLALAFALPLAACVSFGKEPPPTLMTLTADSALQPGATRTAREGETVTVFSPTVPQVLMTQRVAVQASPTAVAYLKKAEWVDQPARLFRSLLSETIAARTGFAVIDQRQYALAPGARLAGRIERFGLDAARSEAVVTYDATLARKPAGPVLTRRFEARVPVAAQTGDAVAPALNQAANQVATDVATWIATP